MNYTLYLFYFKYFFCPQKAKKDKGVVKKPPREMVGMVAKWQKAKKEIEEEEKRLIMESEEEMNKEMDPNYRINKWREEQLQRLPTFLEIYAFSQTCVMPHHE